MSSGEQAGSWGTFERHERQERRGVANYVWLLVGLSALVCVGLLGAGSTVTASSTSELVEHNTLNTVSAHQEQLSESECCAKNFDPEKIYDDPKEIDQMHPNRIDFYGPMFHNFPQGTDTVMEKVSSLKHKLVSLLKRQKAFEAQLQKPVQTTIQVLPGEPGRLGPRGRRGNVGPQGYPGNTGPMGRPGYMGRPGLPGDEGDAGPRGPPGLTGDQGPQGVQGDRGPPGPRGPQGPAGPGGKKGPAGYPGENGPKGMDGQQGNKGPMGQAPRGPPGPAGPVGPKGPQGGKGGKGLRGPAGPPGQSGLQGDPGVKGVDGKPGKDAKRLPKSVCGVEDKVGRSVCCGESPISWQNYGPNAFIDVDARKCKFTDNDVLYFSDVYGSGGQWEEIGISSIYSTSKTGFRIYVHAKHRWRSSVPAWWANALRHRVQWCGVGMSEGPKVNAMCCGVQPSRKIYNWGGAAYTDVDIKACNVAGSPVVITAMAATSASARNYDTIGVSANYYSLGPRAHWFRQWFGGHSRIYWTARRGRARSEGWNPNWCVFGNTFPSGDMQVATDKRFDKDDYPCKGVRVLDDTKVVTEGAKPCCGVTDHNWKQVGGGLLEKRVTTSQCKFKGTPVFLTSVRGNSNHWMTTGTNAYSDYSADGFTMRLMWKHYTIPASMAARHDWRIQWCGIGEME